MIDIQKINEAISEFKNIENLTDFYGLSNNLIKNGFEIEGYLLFLSTWNFARFRYAMKSFNLENFIETVEKVKPYFETIENQSFYSINFDDHYLSIEPIYSSFSSIKGIEFTGASKLMHLMNPKIFVMWDDYIRGGKPRKDYNLLEIFNNGTLEYKKYPTNSNGYLSFLKDMQSRFRHLESLGPKLLTKSIDEFNYVYITLPLQAIGKKKKKKKQVV